LKSKQLLMPIFVIQVLLGFRVMRRMIRTSGGKRISTALRNSERTLTNTRPSSIAINKQVSLGHEQVSILVPVLNERTRLKKCLDGLIEQGEEVAEIIVVDGGSVDGTQAFVSGYAQRDPRICLIDASPIPPDWNGKAWGLETGLRFADPASNWILTIDADVRPKAPLTLSLLEHAKKERVAALSVATLQEIDGLGEGLLHPSLLATLIYRCGMPGKVFRRANEVQANGQCFLFRRDELEVCGGFQGVRLSLCEDVTIARTLVASGYRVGFYEAENLVSVKMYTDWREMWRNWTRSLPMRDRFSEIDSLSGLLEVVFVQALPIPLVFFLATMHLRRSWFMLLNVVLGATRMGVLLGTKRVYSRRPWTYWLSPLCDLPVAVKLARSALQRRHTWRGRLLVRGGMS